ncbi:MAG TPA: hypothetical protein VJR29_05815, partial [bacterium]|nr:hypothetical protein [bacterium]
MLAQSEGNVQRELLSLLGERDPELLGEGLISLAGRQERAGREAFAAQIYSTLSQAPAGELPASIVERADRRLAALSGQGTIGDRAEVLARHFVQEATDPVTLLAMTVGSTAYATARAGLLSRLIAAPSGVFTRGLAARSLAAGGAFAFEVPAFWATNKGLREALRPGSQSWDLASNARELATLGLSLGALKLAGFGATSLHARAGLRNGVSASLFRQAGMFTGILAGHGLERWAGLRPATDGATALFESLVLLLQFNAGASLSHQLLGSRWAGSQAILEGRLQAAIERPRSTGASWSEGLGRPMAMAMAGADGGRPPRPPGESNDFNRPQISRTEGAGNGISDSPARTWQELFREVVARGRRNEIERLKNLLTEALEPQADRSYIAKQLERWRTKDPEEWKSGIDRVTEMLERTPAILQAVQDIAGLREFKADWDIRPHFTKGSEVPIQLGKQGYNNVLMSFVDSVREAMAARPTIVGLRQFLQPRQHRGDVGLLLERPDAEGTTVYFNWRKAGVKIRFSSQGHLTGRIEVRQPFSEGSTVAEIEALPAEPVQMPTSGRPKRKNRAASAERAASERTIPGSSYGPNRGENPTEWALRLLEASRSEDREAAHQIVLEMERRLADPATEKMTREMVERLVVLTGPASHSPR